MPPGFAFDEKTAIQALDRLDSRLPLSTGSPWNSVAIYAALDVKAGKVQGMTAARHTSQDFVALLERLAAVPLGLGRFMSGSTICRRTRPRASSYFLRPTPRCGFT